MTKYNSKLKAQIIKEYFSTTLNTSDLGTKYRIRPSLIAKWIQRYRLIGIESIKPRRHKRQFSAEFKLNVVDYYQTHEESMAEVAAKFDILTSQVSSWRSSFRTDGIKALEPHPKGRPSKVKKTKKIIRDVENKNEVEHLKEELIKKNQELHDIKLERDILKKSLSLFGPSKQEKRLK